MMNCQSHRKRKADTSFLDRLNSPEDGESEANQVHHLSYSHQPIYCGKHQKSAFSHSAEILFLCYFYTEETNIGEVNT